MSSRKPSPNPLFKDFSASDRHKRAEVARKRALSPLRIFLMIMMLPVTTAVIAMGVFIRTSEFEREEAVIHLIALAGCEAIAPIAPGPFLVGEPGYHPRNDPDGDGVACGSVAAPLQSNTTEQQPEPSRPRTVGGAKFVRP
ncbi:excalibur calcium-binding domain-containing protein [Ruegeria atlantica]|uniref:excalibur calcium-binding domain-containing protein n=1 Tax=Ruegeria atlantica TaxID=81569 RepID=UPI00148053AE|nr:excalibur calcium-binding domain-containing protein [Ruegeria atlantica]